MRKFFHKKTASSNNATSSQQAGPPPQPPPAASPRAAPPGASQPAPAASPRTQHHGKQLPAPPAGSDNLPPGQAPVDIFVTTGDQLAEKEQYREAVVMYTQALTLDPTNPDIFVSRSVAHMLSEPMQLEKGLEDARTATDLDQTHFRGWLQQGRIYLMKNQAESAVTSLEAAVRNATGESKLSAQASLAEARALVNKNKASPRERPTSGFQRMPAASSAPNQQSSAPALASTPAPAPVPAPAPAPQQSTSLPVRSAPVTSSPQIVPSIVEPTVAPATPPPTITPAATTGQTPSSTFQATSATPSNSVSPIAEPSPGGLSPTLNPPSPQPAARRLSSDLAQRPTTPVPPSQQPAVTAETSAASIAPQAQAGQATTTQPAWPATAAAAPSATQSAVGRPADEEEVITSTEPPPMYTPNLSSTDPTIRAISQQEYANMAIELQATLQTKSKGSVTLTPYTAPGQVDAVKLLYTGITTAQIPFSPVNQLTNSHSVFRQMYITCTSYPGTTYPDMDCESISTIDGTIPGSLSISGFNEEYRQQQFRVAPPLKIAIESNTVLPILSLDEIVRSLNACQLAPTSEDDVRLAKLLGLPSAGTTRQDRIANICYKLSKSLIAAPSRFKDFSKVRYISQHTLTATGIGADRFLFQMLLGAELLIRLRKEPITTNYIGVITDSISSLVVLASLWMSNATVFYRTAGITNPKLELVPAAIHSRADALLRFAEILEWPYLEEARHCIEEARTNWGSGPSGTGIGLDLCDWLFGTVLPGKIFAHRIMCCLVYASPSIRAKGAAVMYGAGIITKNKSYWPKRTVLARVLGGRPNVKSVCGWVGPLPLPHGMPQGWASCPVPITGFVVPCNKSNGTDPFGGFEVGNGNRDDVYADICNPDSWAIPVPPAAPQDQSARQTLLKSIKFTPIPMDAATSEICQGQKDYRPSLTFEINGTLTDFQLYSTPKFVTPSPCVGTHVLHCRESDAIMSRMVKVPDLKTAYVDPTKLLLIDATCRGEEEAAKAWCAERHRNAIVRKNSETCFACSALMATTTHGLGFNVLIWTNL